MNLNEDDIAELIEDELGIDSTSEEAKKDMLEMAFEEDALSEEDVIESMMYPNGRYEKTWFEKLIFWR